MTDLKNVHMESKLKHPLAVRGRIAHKHPLAVGGRIAPKHPLLFGVE